MVDQSYCQIFYQYCGLDVEFQLLQCQPIIDTIKKQPTGEILAIIADGNRVNQSFFKKMNTVKGKPWLRTDNTILLFDYFFFLMGFLF